jgi:Domain of unknown function (DUF5605)
VRRFWEAALRGGYLSHGETYRREDEQIWWANGGELVGESPARVAFLRGVIATAPGGMLEPVSLDYDVPSAGVAGDYYLIYVGGGRQPRSHVLRLPPGRAYRVEVIDTWNMTIQAVPGTFEGTCTVPLPGLEFIALRLTAVDDGPV